MLRNDFKLFVICLFAFLSINMNSSDTNNCIFCENSLDQDIVEVEKGLQSLIKLSYQKKDGLHKSFEGKQKIKVHKLCRLKYSRPSSIAISKKLNDRSGSTLVPKVSKKSDVEFDYVSYCFLCGEQAILDLKSPHYRRKSIHLVTTKQMMKTLLAKCEERNDDWGEIVKDRIHGVNNISSAQSRYHKCCYRKFLKTESKSTVGRPKSNISQGFEKLCNYIENCEESQFTMQELHSKIEEFSDLKERYSDKHLKNLLKDRFENRLFFSNVSGRINIVGSSNIVGKLLDQLFINREIDLKSERMRIVLAAADIIKEDIQKMEYDCQKYPSIDNIRSGGDDLVPESLKTFTERVTKKKNVSNLNKMDRKRALINQAIVSAVRPRSFISPLQVGIGLTLHRLYGSKHLIELLASLGVSVSYTEISNYTSSLINAGSPKISDGAFIQYVFDNADVNVRTLDGLNTFHAMGGIQCVTPSEYVDTKIEVERLSSGTFNAEKIRVLSYGKRMVKTGLSKVRVKDFAELKDSRQAFSKMTHTMLPINVLWLTGTKKQPGWNGFMTSVMRNKDDSEATTILGVPFINLDPSNPSTIFSALMYASQECKKRNCVCIVTFDQPLFLKSSEIVSSADSGSDLSKIILRLGGFHLLMSFLGSVGKIMEGSGLENLWTTVYGNSTVNHMMNGHAYARCIRAYSLTACALINVIRYSFPEVETIMQVLEHYSDELVKNERSEEDVVNDSKVVDALTLFNSNINHIQNLGRTPKLWINLLTCIDLIMRFIYAERTGDWNMHLDTTIEMLPYFHSAGHLPYAKSAHLYVQQMSQLEEKLTEEELANFKEKGFFTIRRRGKHWSGTWTDMCIEQDLMRPMKSVGGLTHGRGITDNTLTKWILGTPFFIKINEALEDFLGTTIHYSEQHVELRESRKKRDLCDLNKFTTWLQQHNPFTKLSGDLVSLASGFVCDDSVNCDKAYEVGLKTMEKMKGSNFEQIKLHRKDMVKTQAQQKTAKVRSKYVVVNHQQLFNRILCVCDNPEKLKYYLKYELSAVPSSIFDSVSLRKGTKSSLMNVFTDGIVENIDLTDTIYVLDGGWFIHHLPWQKNMTFGDLLDMYYKYIILKYGDKVTIVFDGYPEEPTTKNEEQCRRAARKSSCEIDFQESTMCVTPKDEFLGNKINKKRFTLALANNLSTKGVRVITSEEDADIDIVSTAINQTPSYSNVVVVGSDTDLIVLLVALAPWDASIYFQKIVGDIVNYSIATLITKFSHTRRHLLFTHALTGCDTTSSFYCVGKVKAVEKLKAPEMIDLVEIFLHENQSKEELLLAGESVVLNLYGLSKYTSLNDARYFRFITLTRKSKLRSNFDLAKLPPTSEACHQHLLRVYLQVQSWLGNKLLPADWGWHIDISDQNGVLRKSLKPITSTKPFAPEDLLRLLSCACKKGCGPCCGCRKANLACTAMCESCSGTNCLNSPKNYDTI